MASQVGQSVSFIGNATSPPINTTGAALLVFTLAQFNADPTLVTVTDSNGNTWHVVTPAATGGPVTTETAIWYAFDKAGSPLVAGPGHTVTLAGGTGNSGNIFSAFSGVPTGKNPFLGISSGNGGSLNVQPGTAQLTADSLVITSLGGQGNETSVSIDSSFTIGAIILGKAGVNSGNSMAWVETSTPVNPLWTTAADSAPVSAQIAAFASVPSSPINFVRQIQLNRYEHQKSGVAQALINVVEIGFNFSLTNSIFFNWDSYKNIRGTSVRSVFIDLSLSDSPIQLVDNYSGIPITFQGRSQGWIPLLFNEPLQFTVNFNGGAQAPFLTLRFSSIMMPGVVWRTQ